MIHHYFNILSSIGKGISIKEFGAIGDGIADDTSAIQLGIDSGKTLQFDNGVYLISNSIKVNAPVRINSDDAVVKLPSNFVDSDRFLFSNKERISAFLVRSNNVEFVGALTVDGNQNAFSASNLYCNAITFFNADHAYISDLTSELCHNTILGIGSNKANVKNVSYKRKPGTPGFRNAGVDIQFCEDWHMKSVYADGGEEIVDVNGDCNRILCENLVGRDISQAGFEVNSSHEVELDGILSTDGSISIWVKVQQYQIGQDRGFGFVSSMENKKISLKNVPGHQDYYNWSDAVINDFNLYA